MNEKTIRLCGESILSVDQKVIREKAIEGGLKDVYFIAAKSGQPAQIACPKKRMRDVWNLITDEVVANFREKIRLPHNQMTAEQEKASLSQIKRIAPTAAIGAYHEIRNSSLGLIRSYIPNNLDEKPARQDECWLPSRK